MNLEAYFKRIHYTGSTDVSHATLRDLQQAHLFAVPFENLDIHIPRPIIVDEAAIYDKIVKHGRGGFCFEQNGLFSWALRALGFDVQLLEARVYNADRGAFGNPFEHLTLLVVLEQRYLVDVGFGSGFIAPLRLDDPSIQVQPVGRFRITHDDAWGVYHAQLVGEDELQPGYRFSLTPHDLHEFVAACRFIQSSPDSHFTQKRICSLALPDGRISLTEHKLIRTWLNGDREETPLRNETEFHAALAEHFNIHIQTRPPQRLT
ncbi:MAG: arylamine N-acetyltransferase [Chloroflexi bacterium]|nr:MAG: arylamine N-acetyltransferase [Chloroflexota bacterium]